MARRPREDRPGSWHHVVNRAIAKRPYFEARSDQRYFLAQIAAQVRSGRIEVHAFCLMTTHFHLFVRSPVGELSEAMRRIQYRYSRRFNRLRKRDGPLIRARFFSKRADTDLYRRAIVRYIDVNPVRAGLVSTSAEYEFGSARAYLSGTAPPWLDRSWIQQRALALTGHRRFSPSTYVRAFGPRDAEDVDSLCCFIEARMGSARDRISGLLVHEANRAFGFDRDGGASFSGRCRIESFECGVRSDETVICRRLRRARHVDAARARVAVAEDEEGDEQSGRQEGDTGSESHAPSLTA